MPQIDVTQGALLLIAVAIALLHAVVLLKLWTLPRAALPVASANKADAGGAVAVVIAARDEAQAIAACLRSVLADAAVGQVIVVDDRSSDNTAELANGVAATDARVRVLSSPDLPPGWIGKSHALHSGAKLAEKPYILFADADVAMVPGAVTAAVHLMRDEKLDHLSGFFRIKCESVGEALCAPVFATTATITLFMAAPSGSATGAFNMIGRDFYRTLGGHDRIKTEIVDDVGLARLAQRNGGATRFIDLSSAVSVRLFEGMSGFFRAVVRSTQAYLGNNFVLPMIGGFCTVLVAVLTVANVVLAGSWLSAAAPGDGIWPLVYAVIAVLAYLLGVACAWQVRRFHTGHFFWSLFYPVPIAALGLSTIVSALRKLTGRGVQWRGRSYEIN